LQRAKLEEFSKEFKETNMVNIKYKATELRQKSDCYERFFSNKMDEFSRKNYVNFLSQTSEIEAMVKDTDKLIKECAHLLKEES
jgi:hypothetical protein